MSPDEDDLDRSAEWPPVSVPPEKSKPRRAAPPPPAQVPVPAVSEDDLDRSADWAAVTYRSNKPKVATAQPAALTATDICKQVELGEEAKMLLGEGLKPRQYLDLLIDRKLYQDAACFWVHALPKREAVWWACLCVRAAGAGKLAPEVVAALEVAERWCADPRDDNRRAARPAARAAGFDTSGGWAATAAFWSGGSLSPADAPILAPDELLTAHAVKGAIALTVGPTDPKTTAKLYHQFLALGIEVGEGNNRWK